MRMYYQKHRQIKAFQYDGSLRQLHNEIQKLNPELAEAIFKALMNASNNYIGIAKSSRDYQFSLQWPQWPHQHQKLSHPRRFWHRIFNSQHRTKLSEFKYLGVKQVLHKGQYVTVKVRPKQVVDKLYSHSMKQYHKRRIWVMVIQLCIYDAKDFEAHWSSTPYSKK